jgi:hypothetical protein
MCFLFQATSKVFQTPIVSLASTQSILLSHQVYLTDRIDNKKRDRMPHMKCVCFLQASEDSLEALQTELREPKYGEYYLCQSVNHWLLMAPHRLVTDKVLLQSSAISSASLSLNDWRKLMNTKWSGKCRYGNISMTRRSC